MKTKRFTLIALAVCLLAGCTPETHNIQEQVAIAFEAEAIAYEAEAIAYEMKAATEEAEKERKEVKEERRERELTPEVRELLEEYSNQALRSRSSSSSSLDLASKA